MSQIVLAQPLPERARGSVRVPTRVSPDRRNRAAPAVRCGRARSEQFCHQPPRSDEGCDVAVHVELEGPVGVDVLPEARRVSMIAMNGLAFDLSTPLRDDSDHHRRHHRLRARADPGTYQVWHCAGRARGHRFGRQPGQRPKADRRAPKVLASLLKDAATI